jgi:hypothetical protein
MPLMMLATLLTMPPINTVTNDGGVKPAIASFRYILSSSMSRRLK